MIKINLCPPGELENRFWWVADAVMAAAIIIAGLFSVEYYMNLIEGEIAQVNQEAQELSDKYDQLQPDLERFKSLDEDISRLNTKISALKNITVSRISKYKPIIALEHLHNLSPEGLWYKRIKFSENQAFEIDGESFDNLLLSEMLANLRATESQEDDKADLRTQVYFSGLKLTSTTINKEPNSDFPDIKEAADFKVTGFYVERGQPVPTDNMNMNDQMMNAKYQTRPLKKVGI